jgi:hypothetical protein
MREQGRVRWNRFALVFIPAMVVGSLLFCATVQGAIGAAFVVAGQTIKVSASEIRAFGVSEFGSHLETKNGKPIPVFVTASRRTEIFNLCESYLLRTPLGTATVKVTGGTGGEPVTGVNHVVYAKRLHGHTSYTNLQIGRDASTLDSVPGVIGSPGNVGQYSSVVIVRDSRQIQIALSAESLAIPDSSLRVLIGEHECF